MNKKDYYWLSIRVAGLYLIVDGVRWIPVAVTDGGLQNQLDVGVPLLAGALMLGIRVAGTSPPASEQSVEPASDHSAIDDSANAVASVGGMSIDDWFWVACKAVGLWWAVQLTVLMPMYCLLVVRDPSSWPTNIAGVLGLVVSLWLVLSDQLPRMVARTRRLSSKNLTGGSHDGQAT